VTISDREDRPRLGGQTIEGHRLEIEPRGPFRLDLTAWALRRRSHNAVDRWDSATYERVASVAGAPVALSVTQVAGPDAPRLSVLLAGRRIDQRAQALARETVDRLLGLSVDLSAFAAMAAPDPLLGPLAARMRGLKPPRFPTAFEALVNGVACQQLSLAVGIHLLNRLAADRGRAISDDPNCPRAFPDPDDLASLEPDDLRRHGFSSTKARTIIAIAQAVVAGDLDLDALQRLEDGAAIERLTGLRGIGRWTAEYVLLRGLGRLHVFPGDESARATNSRGCSRSTHRWTTRPSAGSWRAGIHTQASSTSTCCSTRSPAPVMSPGEAGWW
jgi:DNA-3-methyladenine glycosylase II